MEDELEIGDAVIYADPMGVTHNALITQVFPHPGGENPLLNVAYVSNNEKRRDTFGRQIERRSSVPHKDAHPIHGNWWKRLSE